MNKFLFILCLSAVANADVSTDCYLGINVPGETYRWVVQGPEAFLQAGQRDLTLCKGINRNGCVRVNDATVSIVETSAGRNAILWDVFHKDGGNGMGQRWRNRITEFAVKLRITTTTTNLTDRILNQPALRDVTESVICRAIREVAR